MVTQGSRKGFNDGTEATRLRPGQGKKLPFRGEGGRFQKKPKTQHNPKRKKKKKNPTPPHKKKTIMTHTKTHKAEYERKILRLVLIAKTTDSWRSQGGEYAGSTINLALLLHNFIYEMKKEGTHSGISV